MLNACTLKPAAYLKNHQQHFHVESSDTQGLSNGSQEDNGEQQHHKGGEKKGEQDAQDPKSQAGHFCTVSGAASIHHWYISERNNVLLPDREC